MYTHHSIARYLSSGACKFSYGDGFPFIFAGTPISGPLLMSKTLQLYPLVYPDDPNPSTFKAGTRWLKRFKDRHGVRALSVPMRRKRTSILQLSLMQVHAKHRLGSQEESDKSETNKIKMIIFASCTEHTKTVDTYNIMILYYNIMYDCINLYHCKYYYVAIV